MIFYATKKTFERYKLKTVEEFSEPIGNYVKGLIEREKDDRLFEWGMKLFYFDRRKCLVAMNFASKFTVFLMDIKVDELSDVGNFLCYYLTELYKDDEEMQSFLLPKYLSESAQCVFAPLKDKSMISHLNHMVSDFALDGYRFYDFIENGILKTVEINKQANFNFVVSDTIDGKKDYIFPGKRFKTLLVERYMN